MTFEKRLNSRFSELIGEQIAPIEPVDNIDPKKQLAIVAQGVEKERDDIEKDLRKRQPLQKLQGPTDDKFEDIMDELAALLMAKGAEEGLRDEEPEEGLV